MSIYTWAFNDSDSSLFIVLLHEGFAPIAYMKLSLIFSWTKCYSHGALKPAKLHMIFQFLGITWLAQWGSWTTLLRQNIVFIGRTPSNMYLFIYHGNYKAKNSKYFVIVWCHFDVIYFKKGTGTNCRYLKSEPILNVLSDFYFELIYIQVKVVN